MLPENAAREILVTRFRQRRWLVVRTEWAKIGAMSEKGQNPWRCTTREKTMLMFHHIEIFPNFRVEFLRFLAACETSFCLWSRIDESISLKHKHLHLSAESHDKLCHCCHKTTMFRRKNDWQRCKRKPCACDAHELSKIEKGRCMKTHFYRWLVEIEESKGWPLLPDDCVLPSLTKEVRLKSRKNDTKIICGSIE